MEIGRNIVESRVARLATATIAAGAIALGAATPASAEVYSMGGCQRNAIDHRANGPAGGFYPRTMVAEGAANQDNFAQTPNAQGTQTCAVK